MSEIDFTCSQLPPDELAEVVRAYHQAQRKERERLRAKRKNKRLCFGAEDTVRGGLDIAEERYFPVYELNELGDYD